MQSGCMVVQTVVMQSAFSDTVANRPYAGMCIMQYCGMRNIDA